MLVFPSGSGDATLRFTDVALLADSDTKRVLVKAGSSSSVVLQDCWLRGPYLYGMPGSAGLTMTLTNNLCLRSYLSFNTATNKTFTVHARNNLFWGGTVALWNYGSAIDRKSVV